MTGEKKMFTSCDMIENPTERIAFGGNGGGTVVGLGKIVSQSIIQFLMFIWLNLWTTICCPFHNFVRCVTIACSPMRVSPFLEGAMTPLPLRVNSREGFTWCIFHRIKPNLIHSYWQSLA
jgi:hypothetical protein